MARSTFGVMSSRPVLGLDDDATPAMGSRGSEKPAKPRRAKAPQSVLTAKQKRSRARMARYIEAKKEQGTWEERKPARKPRKATPKVEKPKSDKPRKPSVRNASVKHTEAINATQSNAALSTAWEGGAGFYNA